MPNVITSNLYEDFETALEWTKPAKQPLAFAADPVESACAAWRIGNYPDLEDIEITDADRELACQVRRHWLDKLTLQRLQGRTVSSFREKLGAFLVGNRPLYKDEIGMLYHLPYFYFEDLATAELVQSTAAVLPSVPERRDATLTPLKTFSLKRKHGEITQYWWTDPHNRPHCLNIKKDSEHTRLWKSLYNFSSISVNTSVSTKPFMGTDRYYYQIYAVDLLSVA